MSSYKKCKWCGSQFEDRSMFGTEKYCGNKCKTEAAAGGSGGSGGGSSNMVVDAKTNKYDTKVEKERQKGEIALEKERANSEIKKEVISTGLGALKDTLNESKQRAQAEESSILSLDLGDDIETVIKNMDGLLTAFRTKSANQGFLSSGKSANVYVAKIREGITKLRRLDGDNPKVQKEIDYFEKEISGVVLSPIASSAGLNISVSEKKRLVATILCFFLGGLGVHRFYTGHIVSGIFMILTLGGFGIWVLIDFITILSGGFKDKAGNSIKKW